MQQSVRASRCLRVIAASALVGCAAATVVAQVAVGAASIMLATLLVGAIACWLAQRCLQTEICRQRALLDSLHVKSQEQARSQGRFVGNIAHEIKTPLAVVLSQVEVLLRCCNDQEVVRRYGKSIAEETRHLSDLVDGFLRLARPFAQADKSHHAPVHVHDFVVEAVQRSQAVATECGVSIMTKLAEVVPGDAEIEVSGDAALLEAMLGNLVRNAVRFSPRGASVELQVVVQDESVRLFVRDRGAGIAAENIEAVFDWFFDSPRLTLPSAGTGFGLAIARRIAEHHGGQIALRNLPGSGCEFEIVLPRWRAEAQSVPPAGGVAATV
jgi:signal transduction histidine kinase